MNKKKLNWRKKPLKWKYISFQYLCNFHYILCLVAYLYDIHASTCSLNICWYCLFIEDEPQQNMFLIKKAAKTGKINCIIHKLIISSIVNQTKTVLLNKITWLITVNYMSKTVYLLMQAYQKSFFKVPKHLQ